MGISRAGVTFRSFFDSLSFLLSFSFFPSILLDLSFNFLARRGDLPLSESREALVLESSPRGDFLSSEAADLSSCIFFRLGDLVEDFVREVSSGEDGDVSSNSVFARVRTGLSVLGEEDRVLDLDSVDLTTTEVLELRRAIEPLERMTMSSKVSPEAERISGLEFGLA